MKRRKIIFTLLVAFMLTIAMIGTAFADNSFSASLTPNNSRVAKGSEVKVTFKISGINVEGGINGITATLDYDSDVLTLSASGVKGLNDWSVDYNEDTYKLAIDRADVATEDQEVATFTFKVKENTSVTTTAIKLKSIAAGNSTLNEDEKIADITTNISISTGGLNPSSTTTATPTATPTPTPSSTANTQNNTVTNNIVTNGTGANATTTKNEDVPYTGAENYVIPLMLVIAVLGIVSFVNYKRIG